MMRSLYSGVTGLRNHQTRMDVIANNIANVNTVGFKASRVVFQDIYSQTIRPASGPQTVPTPVGGTNAMQIGLGMSVGAIDIMFNSSAAQYTGAPFDLCIQGDGFFVVNTGYTGATNTGVDYYTRAGNFYVDKAGNLLAANGMSVMGWNSTYDATTGLVTTPAEPLDASGNYKATEPVKLPEPGTYLNISITKTGEIVGTDSNGDVQTLGFVAMSTFANNQGLEKNGENLYRETKNSGTPNISLPGDKGAGLLNPGSLEMSNVDLAGEFTDMIVTQRGFQANSRIITVSDTMLEELINLKR